jgi:alkylhydroperoxidase/carboxymuconolactone decarboxylase family protein YurZ
MQLGLARCIVARKPTEGAEMSAQPDDTPVLDLITNINASSIEASSLDLEQQMLARIAALVAVDAPPASYMMNLGAAGATGVTQEQVQGVMAAITPIVGTARVVSAAGKMMRALGLALDLAELEAEAEEE